MQTASFPRGVARLVGVPVLLAVVAERSVAAGSLAVQLRTTRAARRYHSVPAHTRHSHEYSGTH